MLFNLFQWTLYIILCQFRAPNGLIKYVKDIAESHFYFASLTNGKADWVDPKNVRNVLGSEF